VTLATLGVVRIRCGFFKNSKDLFKYILSRYLSSSNSIKTYDLYFLHTYSPF